jgi:hypothetical protein
MAIDSQWSLTRLRPEVRAIHHEVRQPGVTVRALPLEPHERDVALAGADPLWNGRDSWSAVSVRDIGVTAAVAVIDIDYNTLCFLWGDPVEQSVKFSLNPVVTFL